MLLYRASGTRSKSMEENVSLKHRIQTSSSLDYTLEFDSFRHKFDRKPMFLRVNVGGTPFVLMQKNVECYPASRLYHLVCDDYRLEYHDKLPMADGVLEKTSEYFFDRSPVVFEAIAGFFRHGILHKPENACSDEFITDSMYFGILPEYIDHLCPDCSKYLLPLIRMRQPPVPQNDTLDETLSFLQDNNDYEKANGTLENHDAFGAKKENKHLQHLKKTMSLQCYRYYEQAKNAVWTFLEHPETSTLAMVCVFVTFFVTSFWI